MATAVRRLHCDVGERLYVMCCFKVKAMELEEKEWIHELWEIECTETSTYAVH